MHCMIISDILIRTWSLMYRLNSSACRSISILTVFPRESIAGTLPFKFSQAEVTEELRSSSSYDSLSPVDTGFGFKTVPIRADSSWQKLLFKDMWSFCCMDRGSPSPPLLIGRFMDPTPAPHWIGTAEKFGKRIRSEREAKKKLRRDGMS